MVRHAGHGAVEYNWWDRAALPISVRAHSGEDTAQTREDELIDEAAAIVADVNDHSFFANLREILLDEFVQPRPTHIREVDVTDAPVAGGINLFAIALNPDQLAQAVFIRNRLYLHGVGALLRGLRIDCQCDIFIDRVYEKFVGILRRAQRPSIDREQIVSLSYGYARLGKRRTRLLVSVFAGIDLLEAIHASGLVGLEIHSEQAYVHGVQVGIVSATNIGVRVREFADHLAHDIGQGVAVCDRRQQLDIFVAYFVPVHAVHRCFVEIVALLPPDFVEHLLPLGGGINLHSHAAEIERAIADFLGTVGLGIDDAVGVAVASAVGFIKQL